MSEILPPIPTADPGLLERYRDEHVALDAEIAEAEPHVARLVTGLAYRLTVDAISGIAPVVRGTDRTLMFPSPRAFLSSRDRARRAGAEAALDHVGRRLAMERSGAEPRALLPETVFVLHALAESQTGSQRGVTTTVTVEEGPSTRERESKPQSPRVLLEHAIDTCVLSSEPAATRAAWLSLVLSFVRPLEGDNDSTAMLLYLAVAGADLPRGADWGIAEQFSVNREHIRDTLARLRSLFEESAESIDASHYVNVLTELSIDGAASMRDRLAAVGSISHRLARDQSLSREVVAAGLAVFLRRFASPWTIASELGISYSKALSGLQMLASIGLVERCALPASRRETNAHHAYRITDATTEAIRAHLTEQSDRRDEPVLT